MSAFTPAKMEGTDSQSQRATRPFSTAEAAGAAKAERAPKARVEKTARDLKKSIFASKECGVVAE